MRYLFVPLLLALAGCLAVQEPHNPTKKAEGVAPVSSAAAAPVVSATPAPVVSAPRLGKVDLMRSMYSAQRDLNQQILRMAGTLTTEELRYLVWWMDARHRAMEKRLNRAKEGV